MVEGAGWKRLGKFLNRKGENYASISELMGAICHKLWLKATPVGPFPLTGPGDRSA